MPWSTPFEAPIRLRGGGTLTTLQHAADYIMKLPRDEQQQECWQIAIENLIKAAETGGGWLMFARIGMMRALRSATMARQCRFEPLLAVLSQTRQRAALVPPHQAGIAHYIGCNDCR